MVHYTHEEKVGYEKHLRLMLSSTKDGDVVDFPQGNIKFMKKGERLYATIPDIVKIQNMVYDNFFDDHIGNIDNLSNLS